MEILAEVTELCINLIHPFHSLFIDAKLLQKAISFPRCE